MAQSPSMIGQPRQAACMIRLPSLAAGLTPVLLLVSLSSIQGWDRATDEGFAAHVVSATSAFWLGDAPFQSPALDEAEDVAEHATVPQAEQAEDLLKPVRVAVRRTRIGGLYGP